MNFGTPNAAQSALRQRFFRTVVVCGAIGAVAVAASISNKVAAQAGNPDTAAKVTALKEAAAANKQRLRQYTWTETRVLTLKGEQKPPATFQCQYGPDGTVQKTPTSAPPPPPSGGRMKQRVVEKKTDEMKDYMQQVQGLLALYVPPDPSRIQAAYQAGNISVTKALGSDVANLVFTNYAQPGDKMTVAFNSVTKKILTVNVNTYLDQPSEVVTLAIQFASLPDGTNYAQQTVLNATAKQLVVTTTSSNYVKGM